MRDPKGLYAKVTHEGLLNFTGIDSTFDLTSNTDLILKTEVLSVDELVQQVLGKIIV
jgi:adenylylsulfate kinase-like enzyme